MGPDELTVAQQRCSVRALTPAEQREAEAQERYYRQLEQERLERQVETVERYYRQIEQQHNERLVAEYDAAVHAHRLVAARRCTTAPRTRARGAGRPRARRVSSSTRPRGGGDSDPSEPEPLAAGAAA
jgi:hypothetical protein